jgi:hypothetical protein
MTPLEKGMTIAFSFFSLGVLVLFISSVLLGLVDFIRRTIG